MADTVRLGIDWGKARIGVAAANAGTSFAYPVGTVQAGPDELAQWEHPSGFVLDPARSVEDRGRTQLSFVQRS